MQEDKALHFLAGLILSMIFTKYFTKDETIILVLIIAIVKEVIDYYTKGLFCWIDVFFTILPTLIYIK